MFDHSDFNPRADTPDDMMDLIGYRSKPQPQTVVRKNLKRSMPEGYYEAPTLLNGANG